MIYWYNMLFAIHYVWRQCQPNRAISPILWINCCIFFQTVQIWLDPLRSFIDFHMNEDILLQMTQKCNKLLHFRHKGIMPVEYELFIFL